MGVCVPRALICFLKIVNLTVLLHKEFEIPSLHSKFCRDIEVRVSVRSCTQVILRKISYMYTVDHERSQPRGQKIF